MWIQKLKKKTHTFLKKLQNWAKLSSLVLREREEKKTRCFAPLILSTKWTATIIVFWLFASSPRSHLFYFLLIKPHLFHPAHLLGILRKLHCNQPFCFHFKVGHIAKKNPIPKLLPPITQASVLKLRHLEKATKFEKISHLFWQNSCFYSVASKEVWDFSNFCGLFRKAGLYHNALISVELMVLSMYSET